ncbi:hypothetical protein LOC68_12145 [Blastopirellula sp. JC732]|uniref:DUF4375 domain-containing protein n=1 Tax=Blastopirellula sediminis TaxID=2894196 RepID=A0A9X1MMT8_9BACT|nr:hypothetical protein [Blastopirellula sediminis]MCC9607557.1 hypothetical protein [Blastopirellula sediminis]MCC9629150.1 hypothetical protein [Blastopirellula sediminis]
MDFETYWTNLVHRVFDEQETLCGPDELIYRLTSIYGETMVNGIFGYFDQRFLEYDHDLRLLRACGYNDIADDFAKARHLMFGETPLSEESVNEVFERLAEDEENPSPSSESAELDVIYDRLIERLPQLLVERIRSASRTNSSSRTPSKSNGRVTPRSL